MAATALCQEGLPLHWGQAYWAGVLLFRGIHEETIQEVVVYAVFGTLHIFSHRSGLDSRLRLLVATPLEKVRVVLARAALMVTKIMSELIDHYLSKGLSTVDLMISLSRPSFFLSEMIEAGGASISRRKYLRGQKK